MQIIAIVGPAGAGKDTAAKMLSQMIGIPVLVSYTTRPIREGEVDGREHIFVEKCDMPKQDMLAYTEYGGYEYWAMVNQVEDACIYVIDEEGLRSMKRRFPFIDLTTIHIKATRFVRRMRGVSMERMNRDDLREQLPLDYFNFSIHNNGGKDELHAQLRAICEKII